jgi:hypothetical protein
MNIRRVMGTSFLFSMLIAGVAAAQTGGGFDLTRTAVGGGGDWIGNGPLALQATLGQPDVGASRKVGFTLIGGFWPRVTGGGFVPFCASDCNDDGTVSVDELVQAVGIALDDVPLAVCRVADAGGDSDVGVDELILAVRRALAGCTYTPGG